MFRRVSTLLVALALSVPSMARAETELPPPAGPDVVRLKNGGFLRGTISELVPGDYVVIVLVTGKARRVRMEDVIYAGPAQPAESPGGPRTDRGEQARVHLRATDEDVTFHLLTGHSVGKVRSDSGAAEVSSTNYRILCRAPCDATLDLGVQRFALAVGESPPIAASSITVSDGATLEGRYTSFELVRILGWVVGTAGVIAGAAVILQPVASREPGEELDKTPLIAGGAILIGSAILGTILSGIEDRAVVEVAR